MLATKKSPEINSGTYLTQKNYSINPPEEEPIQENPPEAAPEDFSFYYDSEWHDTPAVFSNMSVNEFMSRLEEVDFS